MPRRVEYELTDLGRTLLPAIASLTTWAEKHGAAVIEALDGHGALDGAGGSGDAPGAGGSPGPRLRPTPAPLLCRPSSLSPRAPFPPPPPPCSRRAAAAAVRCTTLELSDPSI
ncbi:hypothetical protein GCM10010400_41250 [Streptomyces aculeolatus]|uniref:winged helix-turn-helix transcriptional regulator n=1 Tax=Streptomyces aculeolatus TaxID=270689 RepID=UPI0027E21504|nr:winged helix-turn-helix transcriptional regulator [Streptomyces aculeolatus]